MKHFFESTFRTDDGAKIETPDSPETARRQMIERRRDASKDPKPSAARDVKRDTSSQRKPDTNPEGARQEMLQRRRDASKQKQTPAAQLTGSGCEEIDLDELRQRIERNKK
jgi:hypothetical protein